MHIHIPDIITLLQHFIRRARDATKLFIIIITEYIDSYCNVGVKLSIELVTFN